ncbi:thioesterase superfamily protein [Denitrovibrio acetiphilus DSM 12809]|uniref:Thioesterase superfamily protein n=1 Tax=Denitrovibrio acetiphilus (strain DSM 12809 / NBRC 114555 / N2460) TaxID=522772 RepID=D4H4E7_DENA2|nr:thioesterase family protein [Denitrovibrio acetiphilus]ADD69276.1 thioesterase superfamily protein [Denitrovibrio acetiphilus DSM 12809]
MKDYAFRMDFSVRDYELDMEGVVNNSVYMNYLEHARHRFLLSMGIDFAGYAEKGIFLIVAKAVLEYKTSLRSGDDFWIGINLIPHSKVRMIFQQDIYRYPDNKLVLKGEITGTGISESGRPKLPDEILEKLGAL